MNLIHYETPYVEQHVRWCERTVSELIAHLLPDSPAEAFLIAASGSRLIAIIADLYIIMTCS